MRGGTQLCQYNFISHFPPPTNIDFFLPFLLKSLNSFLLLRAVGIAGNMSYMALVIGPVWLVHNHSLCIISFLVLNVPHFLSLSTVQTFWLKCTCLPLCKLILQIFRGELRFNLSALCGAFSENNFSLFSNPVHTQIKQQRNTGLACLFEAVIAYCISLM